MEKKSILIIDDNALNLKLARVILSGEGYDIQTADDAEQALKILETFTPQLILMDIQLPGIDGLELTRRLKSRQATQDIIILALTAYAMKGDKEKAYAAGCDGYIMKPINPDLLPEEVARYLSRQSSNKT